jgi:galactokinase
VVGARMMGGGFGGCTINLVYDDFIDEFVQNVMDAYRDTFKIDPDSYKVHLMDGTSVV